MPHHTLTASTNILLPTFPYHKVLLVSALISNMLYLSQTLGESRKKEPQSPVKAKRVMISSTPSTFTNNITNNTNTLSGKRKWNDTINNGTTNEHQERKMKRSHDLSNYEGLPMFKVHQEFVPAFMAGTNNTRSRMLRPGDLGISFVSPKAYGQCYFFNAKIHDLTKASQTTEAPVDRLTIETLGALDTFGFKKQDSFNEGNSFLKSSITLKIPVDSQTFATLLKFEKVVQKAFDEFAPTWQKANSSYEHVSFLRHEEGSDSAMLKCSIERSKKDNNKITSQISALGPDDSNEDFKDGFEAITPMSKVRVLLSWTGCKIINSSRKVYHNLKLTTCQVVSLRPEKKSFDSKFNPMDPAP